MKAEAAKGGLENVIRFLGKASDEVLEEELKQCDVLVFPSVANSEAFGLVQLEAMAFRKACNQYELVYRSAVGQHS